MARQDSENNKNPLMIWGILTGLGIWLGTVSTLFLERMKLPPQIPLFYSLPWGEGWLINKDKIWMVFAGFAFIWIINNTIAIFKGREEPLLANYLVWGSALAQMLLAITILRTMFIIL